MRHLHKAQYKAWCSRSQRRAPPSGLHIPNLLPFPGHPQQQGGQLWWVQSVQRFLPCVGECAPQAVREKFLQEEPSSWKDSMTIPIFSAPSQRCTSSPALFFGTSEEDDKMPVSPAHLYQVAPPPRCPCGRLHSAHTSH